MRSVLVAMTITILNLVVECHGCHKSSAGVVIPQSLRRTRTILHQGLASWHWTSHKVTTVMDDIRGRGPDPETVSAPIARIPFSCWSSMYHSDSARVDKAFALTSAPLPVHRFRESLLAPTYSTLATECQWYPKAGYNLSSVPVGPDSLLASKAL